MLTQAAWLYFAWGWAIYETKTEFIHIRKTNARNKNISTKIDKYEIRSKQSMKKLGFMTNISGMSPTNFRKISHPELDLSLYLSSFSKEVSQLTDWQTYKKYRIIWKWCNNIPGMSPKKSERYLNENQRYPYICLISVRK